MSLAHREYASYDEYVRLQGRKASRRREALLANLPTDIAKWTHAFRAAASHLNPGAVLCLGARTGSEVTAASQAGFRGSVGIDLHPVGPAVMRADWHALPFADASFPNVYSNSLDHCLYLDRLAAEVRRVLVPGGIFFLMASDKPGPGKNRERWLASGGTHEALYWDHADELRDALLPYGFASVTAWRSGCWGHYILRRIDR